jgi:hypothetical protein
VVDVVDDRILRLRNAAMSAAEKSSPRRISSVCSPSFGAGLRMAPGVAESFGTINTGDGGGEDPPPGDEDTHTIAAVQGDGAESPLVGEAVTTSGVVTAAYPTGGFDGYYLQTPGSGGDAALDEHVEHRSAVGGSGVGVIGTGVAGTGVGAPAGGAKAPAVGVGVVGAVIDGPATDFNEIRRCKMPIWCIGPAPITTKLLGLDGAFNVPVSVGGQAVEPGDAVLADESGVLFLKPDQCLALAERAIAMQERELTVLERLRSGEKLPEITGASDKVNAAMRALAAE